MSRNHVVGSPNQGGCVDCRDSEGRYILYGAVVDVPDSFSYGVKHSIKRFVDKSAFRFGYVDRIDYRNYQDGRAYNRGDHSIIVSMAQRIGALDADGRIVAVQWGGLESAKLESTDKVLICGSGYFFPDAIGRLPQRMFSDLRAIEAAGCELHFIGAGYNRLLAWERSGARGLSVESCHLLRRLLERASTISVRDDNTKIFLSGLVDKNISVIGDPALFIDSPISVADYFGGGVPSRIGLNIPFHGPQSTAWVKKNFRQFIDAVREIQKLTKCEFVYFVHYDSELLIADILRSYGVRLDVVNAVADRLSCEYAKIDMHIGGMLHSCIIAAAAGVPSVGLAYDEKHFGFFSLMGRFRYCLDARLFRSEKLIERALELWRDLPGERSRMNARRCELFRVFDSTLRKVMFSSVP
ncbi:polysaccharide pyruvyl transferase family protein [Oryzisolibacter sp. LB2S]|uniref:polysaccharide pyruvyl transferase family protein n=1 Tax=Alicycliphilus soli TaxID=3228789 RepID=UPI00345AFF86